MSQSMLNMPRNITNGEDALFYITYSNLNATEQMYARVINSISLIHNTIKLAFTFQCIKLPLSYIMYET